MSCESHKGWPALAGFLVDCVDTRQIVEKALSSRRALFCLSCGSGFGINKWPDKWPNKLDREAEDDFADVLRRKESKQRKALWENRIVGCHRQAWNSISQKDWLFRTCRQFQEWILESVIKIIVFWAKCSMNGKYHWTFGLIIYPVHVAADTLQVASLQPTLQSIGCDVDGK